MRSCFAPGTSSYIKEQTHKFVAHNYNPFPVALSRGKGVWVWDVAGKAYIDMLSSYSATNFGHGHPRLVRTLKEQTDKLAIMTRCFLTDNLGEFCESLVKLCDAGRLRLDKVLPMNSGAEAVETALKLARKYAYTPEGKGVPSNQAEIIVCENNFHGRTTTIVGFSTTEKYKRYFGPYDGGFRTVPFGDIKALEAAINRNTAAFLVEPIQGEGGVNVPPPGYLAEAAALCEEMGVLLIFDEVQTGFGRTGNDFAFKYEGVIPNIITLGKALGGGLLPVSAVVADTFVMDILEPGEHGSTFGGNPLACAVGIEAMKVLVEERLSDQAYNTGFYFKNQLECLGTNHIKDVRGRGLMVGLELDINGHRFCEKMIEKGVLCQVAREGNLVRLSPPLVITHDEVDLTLERIKTVLDKF